ncbi:MAG: hypothetical protein H6732_14790 [Alphaproteobacteria bacterium]|nr:hypothetical protein [Alphaproteobacteria bacterium]
MGKRTDVLAALLLGACAGPASDTASEGDPCVEGMRRDEAFGGFDDVDAVRAAVQQACFPELDGVEVVVVPLSSPSDTFVASVDVTTLDAPGPERTYRLSANPVLLQAPMPRAAAWAILAHELTHVRDYVGMDADTLAAWALDYASGPITAYERQTDEHALELGLAEGLKAFRLWLYDQLDDEAEAAKRRDYYTPDEIDAWVADHPPT